MPHLEEHKLLADRKHVFWKMHSSEIQLITIINGWAKLLGKGGQADTFFRTFRKLSTHLLMNYVNASYMAVVLVEKKLRNG